MCGLLDGADLARDATEDAVGITARLRLCGYCHRICRVGGGVPPGAVAEPRRGLHQRPEAEVHQDHQEKQVQEITVCTNKRLGESI